MELKPIILCHPNVPKPLHGVNPRNIMGHKWWDLIRRKVYESSDNHCIACGVHKSEAKEKKWLEAHEFWEIDYYTGKCVILSIEPLCHYCHNFIHSGRLAKIQIEEWKLDAILEHGFKILSDNKLKCFPGTLTLGIERMCNTFNVEPYEISINPKLCWADWHLDWNNKVYRSNFNNETEWNNFYGKKH